MDRDGIFYGDARTLGADWIGIFETGPDRIGTPDPVDRTGPDRIPDRDILKVRSLSLVEVARHKGDTGRKRACLDVLRRRRSKFPKSCASKSY